jgi:hypothetical protein
MGMGKGIKIGNEEIPERVQGEKKTIDIFPGYEFVKITNEEFQKLIKKLGTEIRARAALDILENAIGAKGYKYKSHYRAILSWVIGELEKREKQNVNLNQSKTWVPK